LVRLGLDVLLLLDETRPVPYFTGTVEGPACHELTMASADLAVSACSRAGVDRIVTRRLSQSHTLAH
jgi:hypothetical protein